KERRLNRGAITRRGGRLTYAARRLSEGDVAYLQLLDDAFAKGRLDGHGCSIGLGEPIVLVDGSKDGRPRSRLTEMLDPEQVIPQVRDRALEPIHLRDGVVSHRDEEARARRGVIHRAGEFCGKTILPFVWWVI